MTPADQAALRDLAARLVVGLAGPELGADERAWIARWRPAGVILFARNVTDGGQLAALCRELRAVLPAEAEIVADHEGGPVSVLAAALGAPPAPWSLGVLDDPDLTRRVHAETGRRLRRCGIDRALAPCADVLREPRNPVIGARSFGAGADLVARHAAAAVRGLAEGGVAAAPKHWPGHGGTAGDSHDGVVEPGTGLDDAPFAAGILAGADALLVGHLADARAAGAPGDPAAGRLPATLDAAACRRARGLVPGGRLRLYADDVTMGALRAPLRAQGIEIPGPREGLADPATLPLDWFRALAAAGCDRLLCRGIPRGTFPLAPEAQDPRAPRPPSAAAAPPDPDAVGSGEEGPYREARRRLAAAQGEPLLDWPGEELVWLDATGGDRWGEAAGLAPLLSTRCRRVRRLAPASAPPPGSSSLLVTSHRPLGREALASLSGLDAGPGPGRAVLLGHPSLADDLRGVLGGRWELRSAHDVRPADLAPFLPQGT